MYFLSDPAKMIADWMGHSGVFFIWCESYAFCLVLVPGATAQFE